MLKDIYKILEKPYSSPHGKIVQQIILINLLINIFASFSKMVFYFSDSVVEVLHTIEMVTVGVFVVELLARYVSIGYDSRYKGFMGRVRFTFTPLVIIDIVSLIPYFVATIPSDIILARFIRLLRFFKILKLIRLKEIIKKFFSISAFASASIFTQIAILFVFSVFFITLFSFAYSGEKTSIMIFLDPPAISEAKNNIEMFFGVIELMLGLLIAGTLISIISELVSNITSNIKQGYHPYKRKNHIIIVNYNSKLEFVLKEINHFYKGIEEIQDVVLFLPFVSDIEGFSQNLKKHTNIDTYIITGEELNWNSYEKLNINFAQKILLLKQKDSSVKNLNIKITRYILSHEDFNNSGLEFLIEAQENHITKKVYEQIFYKTQNHYSLIEHNLVIQRFLNRSIVEPDYFKIYLKLLSYGGSEFYRLDADEVFKKEISFEDAYMQFSGGVLVGVRKDGKLMLNPPKDTIIYPKDKLVTILENKLEFVINSNYIATKTNLHVQPPNTKISKKVCIVGEYDCIDTKEIAQFLSEGSKVDKIVSKDDDYLRGDFWKDIIDKRYDVIILNMEDDYEFILTMYLRSTYRDKKEFLNSLINIIHNPTIAKILQGKDDKYSNIILSEKLVGEYAVQVLFNRGVADIFDKITQASGRQFYLLEATRYKELFKMSYNEVKLNLLYNSMLYIGVIKDGEFISDYKNIKQAQKIVVFA